MTSVLEVQDHSMTKLIYSQRCNHGEIFGATSAMVGQNLPPPGWNRVKVSENSPVTPAVFVPPKDSNEKFGLSEKHTKF